MELANDARDIEYLRKLALFSKAPAWVLEAVAESVEDVNARKGQVLLKRGTDDGYTYFLLEGQVTFASGDGEKNEMAVSSETVATPIANVRPRLFSVEARSKVRGFRIPDLVLATALAGVENDGQLDDKLDAERARQREVEHELGFLLHRDLKEDKAILPSLPDLASKIQRYVEDKKSNLKTVARLIEQDPSMTAKVIRTANSAFYARRGTVETCSAAVIRLGARATHKLIMSFCMHEVFRSPKPELRQRMEALWNHSVDVAAISFVLAHRARGFGHDPEEVMLAGLLHDVGTIAILNYAQKWPRLTGDLKGLDEHIGRLRGELGAMILRKWAFAPKIIAAAREAEDWLRKHKGLADISDVVIVAQMHDCMNKGGLTGLPPMDEISAVKRVLGRQVTPDMSLAVIKEAQSQIADIRALLVG